ncbi:unnamed protein product, partial [Timema podura]|nr:unnamed protein product [Timema podura]
RIICFVQELPDKWNTTKKIAVTVKQGVAPIMAAEVTLIRKRLVLFDHTQTQFRDSFRKMDFFKYSCEDVYEKINLAQMEILELEEQMKSIVEQSTIFEVNVPDFKSLKACRKEIKLIKIFCWVVGMERSQLSLVRTNEELLGCKKKVEALV